MNATSIVEFDNQQANVGSINPNPSSLGKFNIPIIALGLGEKEDDLEIFDSEIFANTFVKSN